jgi:hypothetical protein
MKLQLDPAEVDWMQTANNPEYWRLQAQSQGVIIFCA